MSKRLTKEEIENLYLEYGTPEHVKGHCKGVTECALNLAKALNEHGFNFDLDMIYGAGMTHDMARLKDRHWDVAADKLEELGYFDEAKIVRIHMEPSRYNPIDKLTESDMVNLGDRLVKESEYVGIDERFDYIINKAKMYGDNDTDRILRNKKKMKSLLDDIEKVVGKSIDEICGE